MVIEHTPGLAERTTGQSDKSLSGEDFVQLLRSDDRDRIYFAREGQQGSPQTLVHIPLDEPGAKQVSGADEAPSLMLLVDSSVGVGGAWEGSEFVGSSNNILTWLIVASVAAPLAGLAFAYWSYGTLWG